MPAKGAPTRLKPIRLQTVQKLRIKSVRRIDEAASCTTIMSSLLNCWATQGHNMQGCAALEQQLRACADAKKPGKPPRNMINATLSRLFPKMAGPRKKN